MNKTTIVNRGVSGDTTEGFLKRMESITKLNPKKVFIMGGINDIRKSIDIQIIYTNYISIIETLKDDNIEPIIQSTLFTSCKNKNVKLLNIKLKNYAEKENIKFLNLNEKLSNNELLINEYTRDGTHLNAKGYNVWREQLIPYMQ